MDRRFINKALKLADFYTIKSVRSNFSLQVRGMSSMGDVDNIKRSFRLSLQAILKEHIGVLSTNEYKSFNLGNGIEDYILPSLNLSPKVHKLKERACMCCAM